MTRGRTCGGCVISCERKGLEVEIKLQYGTTLFASCFAKNFWSELILKECRALVTFSKDDEGFEIKLLISAGIVEIPEEIAVTKVCRDGAPL